MQNQPVAAVSVNGKHADRIEAIRSIMQESNSDAVLLTFLPDIQWACGFSGSNGLLLILRDSAHFVTDGRYLVQSRNEVRGAEVHVPGYELIEHVVSEGLLTGVNRLLYQADHVSVAQATEFDNSFDGVDLIAGSDLLVPLVGRKDDEEVQSIRAAQEITDAVFEHLLNFIEPGMREKEIAAEIVYQHLRRGADRMSFSSIVASGSNGALPHAKPSEKRIAPHELVVLDFGCFLNGYASDMTRTISIGAPSDEQRRVYELVLTAQESAIDAAQSGMTSVELDAVARRVITDGGYGEQFSHGLGHGVGLQIHEWPRVSYHVETMLPAGAVVTIEPGVYIPGEFGVRIEDIIVLREGGCDNLTGARKDLVVL